MSAGCRNPNAANYNGSATSENYSCMYVRKNQGICHLFTDVQPEDIVDNSFTLSYSIKGESWVLFHDYIPDFYIQARSQLFTAKNNKIYKHNAGPAGNFYGTVYPFFIDVVFAAEGDLLLETVNWMTEYLDSDTDQPFKTLSHITIWNSYQHSGRIALDVIFKDLYQQTRETKGSWILNDFRNVLKDKGPKFLKDIFSNYMLDNSKADFDLPFYSQEILRDKWFCIRFEFDNSADTSLVLHDTTIQALKSDR